MGEGIRAETQRIVVAEAYQWSHLLATFANCGNVFLQTEWSACGLFVNVIVSTKPRVYRACVYYAWATENARVETVAPEYSSGKRDRQ